MVRRSTASFSEPGQELPGRHDQLTSNFEHHESNFEHNDMDATDLDTGREPGGPLHLMNPDRSDRLFLEDNPSIRVGPSITRRIFRGLAALAFLVLVGVGGAVAWRSSGGDLAMVKAWAPSLAELLSTSTSKPAAAPVGPEIQQQLKSMAADLAALKHTVGQLAANQDQLTHAQEQMSRTQEQMTRAQEQMAQSIATLQAGEQPAHKLSSQPPAKLAPLPPPKPVQHPAQLTTPAPSKPANLPPPQSLQPQDNNK
jgi:chemotaxis protein histidine kinase CheA